MGHINTASVNYKNKFIKLMNIKKEGVPRGSIDVTGSFNSVVEVVQNTSSIGTSLDAAKQVLGVVSAVSEAVKPFIPLIGIVTLLAEEIIQVYENAQYNKKICNVFI